MPTLSAPDRSKRLWTVLGTCAVAVLVLTTGYRLYQAMQKVQQKQPAQPPPLKLIHDKAVSRDEFLEAVVGRTKDEVRTAFGPPARETDDGREWKYARITWGVTGRGMFIDTGTTVRFDPAGIGVGVDFPAATDEPGRP